MTRSEVLSNITALAERQHGVVSVDQQRELGADAIFWRWARANGILEPMSRRVDRLGGSVRSPLQRGMAAVLHAGGLAAISHESAAGFHGTSGYRLDHGLVHVVIPIDRAKPVIAGVVVHRSRRLTEEDVCLYGTVPVTTPARTVFDVSSQPDHDLHKRERALDSTLSRGKATDRRIHRTAQRLLCRGRRGTKDLRALLLDRPPGSPKLTSLERRAQRVLTRLGFPPLRWQVDVGDGDEWLGRVDGIWDDVPCIVEIDSDLHHSSHSDARRDEQRDEAMLERGGRIVVRLSEHIVWFDEAEVERRSLAGRDQARRLRSRHKTAP